MRRLICLLAAFAAIASYADQISAQGTPPANDTSVRTLVGRLELERYKATIKDLTQFGDRRQGTDRNRAAVDWIEAQLKSYGCTNTERIKYEYNGRQLRNDSTNAVDLAAGRQVPGAGRGNARAGGAGADTTGRGRGAGAAAGAGAGRGAGGGRGTANPVKGFRAPTGVNTNPDFAA